jgi:gliding motility-associatede transport system auxiliary component
MAEARQQGRSWAERLFGRNLRFGTNLAIAAIVVLVIITLVEAISLRHSHRFDLTANKRYSLSPQSQQLLTGLPQPVKATAFYQDMQREREAAKDLLDQYAYYGKQFTYEFIDPDRNPGLAKHYGITSYGTIVLESGAKDEKVLVADEENLTNGLLKVMREGKKVVYFLEGHGEHSINNTERDGYAESKRAIESQNYLVKSLNLLTEGKIPDDASILIVAGPRKDLLEPEFAELTRFIERGGKVMFLVDPEGPPGLPKFLGDYGIQVVEGVVVDLVSRLFGGDFLMPVITTYEQHPITKNFEVASFLPMALSVKTTDKMPEGVSAQVLAKTSPNSWLKRDLEELKTELRSEGRPLLNERLDEKGPVPVAVVATVTLRRDGSPDKEPKKARIVVVGDSDFASNNYLNLSGNRDLFLNTVSWLAEEENLIAIRPKESGSFFTPVTANQERLVFWLSMIVLPAVVVGSGVATYIWRRQSG